MWPIHEHRSSCWRQKLGNPSTTNRLDTHNFHNIQKILSIKSVIDFSKPTLKIRGWFLETLLQATISLRINNPSKICLPLIKADWFILTTLTITSSNLLAKSLQIILYWQPIRLIRLKSLTAFRFLNFKIIRSLIKWREKRDI